MFSASSDEDIYDYGINIRTSLTLPLKHLMSKKFVRTLNDV